MRKILKLVTLFCIIFSNSYANEVNIFSARHYDSDVQLYEKFTAKTGIKVNVVSGKSGALEKRIIEEGACLLYTSPSPRDRQKSRMPSSA